MTGDKLGNLLKIVGILCLIIIIIFIIMLIIVVIDIKIILIPDLVNTFKNISNNVEIITEKITIFN